MIQSVIRENTALTIEYQACAVVSVHDVDVICLLFEFTKGSSSGFSFVVEKSTDGVTFYNELEQRQQGGITTYVKNVRNVVLDTDANVYIEIPVASEFIRIQVSALTSATNAALKVIAAKRYF